MDTIPGQLMRSRHLHTVLLHKNAPAKPELGEPCNRCGVCCAAELCPPGRIVFRQFLDGTGPCPALTWSDEQYACGLLTQADKHLGWLPKSLHPLLARSLYRWIAAGKGCDSAVTATLPEASLPGQACSSRARRGQ